MNAASEIRRTRPEAEIGADETGGYERTMTWTIEAVRTPRYLKLTLRGKVSIASLADAMSEIASHKQWRAGMGLLIDDSKVNIIDVDSSDIDAMARLMEFFGREFKRSRIAVVAGSPVQEGLARQFQVRAESKTSVKVGVFVEEKAAIAWLAKK